MDLLRAADEHAIGELHDVRFMEHRHLLTASLARIAERKLGNASACRLRCEFDTRRHLRRELILETCVKTFCVLANDDEIHVLITRLHAVHVAHWSHRRIKIECLAKQHIHGTESTSDRRRAWTLQRNAAVRDHVER